MKKFLGILAIVFIVISCSNDDESTHPIVGTWIMTGYFLEEPEDNNGDGIYSDNFLDELTCLEREYIFIEDGSFELTLMLVTVNNDTGIWSCARIETILGSFILNDDEITIVLNTGSTNTNTYDFELTDDILVLRSDYVEIVLEKQ